MRATAASEQDAGGMVATVEQVSPWHRGAVERAGVGAIAVTVVFGFKVSEELGPGLFGFSDEDHVRVLLCFIGQQGDVRPAECNRDSALAKSRRETIGVRSTGRVKGDRYQVSGHLKIDRLHRFIHMEHRPTGRHEGREVGHGDLLEVQDSTPPDALDLRRRSSNE